MPSIHSWPSRLLRCGGALALTAAAAAQGAWSTEFDQPGFGTAGRVFALGTWRNELIAGTYLTPQRDGVALNHVARFDGVRWHALGAGVSGTVRAAIEYQGDLYVGGLFGLAGGVPATCVARWDGSQWHAVGAGFNNQVWALCEHQGDLYAAGEFVVSGSQPIRSLARWDGSQWLEVGGGLRRTLYAYTTARALLSAGNLLYVGGQFDQAGTTSVGRVAAWDGVSWHGLNGGVSGSDVWTLAAHNGRIYCGGAFSHAGGSAAPLLAAWNGNQWAPVGAPLQALFYAPRVTALCVHQNALHVGGSFTDDGASTLYNVARFDGVGFQSIGGVGRAEVNPPEIYSMVSWNSRLYCGGEFQVAGDLSQATETRAVYHLAAYDGTVWSHVGDGLGLDDEVRVLGRYQGQIVAGGYFVQAGTADVFGLARFEGDGWRHFGTFGNGAVLDFCEHHGELWVAGTFDTVNGLWANGVARFDGSQWHDVGGGPGALKAYCIESYQGNIHIGSLGSPKRWTGTVWQTFAPTISGTVNDLHVHQGLLYIGATTAGTSRLHAWDGSSLTVPGGGVNGDVVALASFGGDLVVGGRFSTAGGLPAKRIASWNGTSWSAVGSGFHGAGVFSLAVFDGTLVAGGGFDTLLGDPDNTLARWTGTAWTAFAPTTPNGAVHALLPDDSLGELWVGGNFNRLGTRDAPYLVVWQDVPRWTTVGQPLGSPRRTPVLSGDGTLQPGSHLAWRLSSARESALAVFVTGLSRIDAPVFGGIVVPSLDLMTVVATDSIGTATVAVPWLGLPPGLDVWTQVGIDDPGAPQGWTMTNTVWLRVP